MFIFSYLLNRRNLYLDLDLDNIGNPVKNNLPITKPNTNRNKTVRISLSNEIGNRARIEFGKNIFSGLREIIELIHQKKPITNRFDLLRNGDYDKLHRIKLV